MKFEWICQGGFIFVSDNYKLVVDPYLSDFVEGEHKLTRLTSTETTVENLNPDAILCSHDHIDHFDPVAIPQIAEKYSDCLFSGPSSVAKKCKENNIPQEKILEMNIGKTCSIGPFKITPLPAMHSDKDAVGFLIEAKGKKVYLSADSEYNEEWAEEIRTLAGTNIDTAFVCINGRWGNMNSEEALKLVKKISPKTALPMHYNLFAENTADPKPFVENCLKAGINSFEMINGKEYKI